MSGRASGRVAEDRTLAVQRLRRELVGEREAREALVEAQGGVGSALVLARMAGVPWRELSTQTGMSRQSMLERMARWDREPGEGTRFRQPELVMASTDPRRADDGTGEEPPDWWGDPIVEQLVRSALEWVLMATRRELADEPDSARVAAESARRVAAAGAAGLAECRRVLAADSRVSVRELASRCAAAAASVVPEPLPEPDAEGEESDAGE